MLSKSDYDLVQADLARRRIDPNPPQPGLIHRARTLLGLTPTNYFGTRPVFLDVNTIHQKINWPALKDSPIVGIIDKAGEWDGTAGPNSWLNPNFALNCQGAADAGKEFLMYIFTQCGAEYLNRQMTEKDVNDIFDLGTTDDDRMARMLRIVNGVPVFPEMYIIVRQLAIGDGWLTNPAWLKTARFRTVKKIVLDGERYWMNYNQYLSYLRGNLPFDQVVKIPHYWIGFSNKHLHEKLAWAMAHGYLPQLDIEVENPYSGKWFINQYSAEYGTFLETKETWPALWYSSKTQTLTIDALINTFLASIPDSWKASANFKAAMFGKSQRLLQLGVVIVPEVTDLAGKPSSCQVDVYVGVEDVKTWLKIQAPPPPGPEPCPAGQHRDAAGNCVPDETTPPEVLARLTALESRAQMLENDVDAMASRIDNDEARLKTLEDLRGQIKNLL